jgi:two-component system, OmpR family, osmolarity sensor histidine kinase EnvZ
MRLIPKSLLARTALVILVALVTSQLLSVYLFRYYSREPRIQLSAIGFITQLRTIRTALAVVPPERHDDLIQRLREERGLRVLRPRSNEELRRAPDFPALRPLRERLKTEFGEESDVFMRPQTKPGVPAALVVKIDAEGTPFWVVFPRSRVNEQDFSWAWTGWAAFGAVMALAGAVFLVSRVTKPLRSLASAARELGQGKNPGPVAETGPSEVKSVAVAFNQMREDLARVERERATFLAGISHDVRSPLARLRLGLEMLPNEADARREMMKDLEKDITDIDAVVEQFLDFGRDESSERAEMIDVNAIARDVAASATRSGANIALALDTIAPTLLRPMAVRRVMANLIDNAVKHAGGEVTLQTRATPQQVVISVLDRGAGIAAADAERLKQPFTRFSEARSGASGAGLGLAIVDRIARIHHGAFELLPREGGGLEARVTLLPVVSG